MFGLNLTFQMLVFRKCLIHLNPLNIAMFMEGTTKKYVGRGPFFESLFMGPTFSAAGPRDDHGGRAFRFPQWICFLIL